PSCCTCPPVRIVGQQSRVPVGNMKDDGPGFEQDEIVLFVSGYLPERVPGTMFGLLGLVQCQIADGTGAADFFQCPADAQVAHKALCACWYPVEGSNGDVH